jgi:hypothetical protein
LNLAQGLRELGLQLLYLPCDARRSGGSDPNQGSKEGEHNENGSKAARHPFPLQPVHAGGKRKSEQHSQESEQDYGASDPEQLKSDVKAGNNGDSAENVAGPPSRLVIAVLASSRHAHTMPRPR